MQDGRFNLFVEDTADVHAHRMRYRVRLHATDGRTFYFDAMKLIRRRQASRRLAIHHDPVRHRPCRCRSPRRRCIGRGILHIKPADFARQLTTLDVRNAPDAITTRATAR